MASKTLSCRGVFLVLVALVALVATSTGCTVLGFGIGAAAGAATDRCETVGPEMPPPSTGADVQVRVASSGPSEEWVEGRYGGERNGALIVWHGDGPVCARADDAKGRQEHRGECAIPLDSVREVRVRRGSHVERGMGIGAAIGALIDVVVVVAVFASFSGPFH